jgi:hypothetical protein
MGGSGVIDQFLNTFTTYIDSGFGLLGGDVKFLSSTLIAIDVTLAGLPAPTYRLRIFSIQAASPRSALRPASRCSTPPAN